MSVTETATDNGKPGQKRSGLNLSAEDIEDLRQLDAAVNRIRKQIPETPYIVTVPCAEPRYHHPSRERAESWCKDTPFTPDEGRLQYMSFMYREPGTDCFVLRTEVDEERDRRRFFGVNSGTSTPMQSTGPKKKISFGAYKNRKANASPAKLAGNEDAMENKDQAQVNGHKAETQQPAHASKLEVPRGQKRPLDETADNKPPHTKSDEESPPPAKIPRLSPSPPTQNISDPSAPSHSTPHGLPPMLSPTGIPNTHGLPPLLSPTLPANIEAELERIDQAKKAGRTVTPVSDKKVPSSTRPALGSAQNLSSGSKSSGTDAPQKGVARVVKKDDPLSPSIRKSEAQKQLSTPNIKPVSQPAEAKPKRLTTNGDAARPSKLSPSPAPPPQKETVADKLIVKLKYGRKNRMLVKQILKLPQGKIRAQNAKEHAEADKREAKTRTKEAASASSSPAVSPKAVVRPKKTDTPAQKEEAKSSKDALKRTAEKPASATARLATGEKRPRPHDEAATDAPAAKRHKPPSALDLDKKPSTPAQPAILSPALSNRSSAQKAQHLASLQQHSSLQHLTPKKDHRISLIHSASNESLDATITPKQVAGNTPSASQPTSSNPGPTSAPNGRAAEIQALLSRSRSLNELGRRIKHATTAILSKTSPASPRTAATATMDAERKLAAVTSIECILTYMLAYHAADLQMRAQGKQADVDGNWATLIPLWRFFRSATGEWPELDALRLRLGAVICARVVEALTRRAGEAARGERAESSGLVLGERDQDALIRHAEIMLGSQREADAKLGFEDLMAAFPKAWEGRTRKGEEVKKNSAVTDFSGAYALPLDAVTPPVVAVRAGLALLEEWCEREKVEWVRQLKLEWET